MVSRERTIPGRIRKGRHKCHIGDTSWVIQVPTKVISTCPEKNIVRLKVIQMHVQ